MAQYLSGWLEFNRGRYREALPGLRATIARFERHEVALDAAWFVTLAHYLLGEPDQALTGLAVYERLAEKKDPDAHRRAAYWRARMLEQGGQKDTARAILRDVAHRWPLSYYGLLARRRLAAAGETVARLAPSDEAMPQQLDARVKLDPAVVRADVLAAAGLNVEAGIELRLSEAELRKRFGGAASLRVLLDRYPRFGNFRRARELAEAWGPRELAAEPAGAGRMFWEAAYPRAFRQEIEPGARDAKVPDVFAYAIMHKESGFSPHEVSYADARGLMQLLPAAGAEMAKAQDEPFFADELLDPPTNVRLGTRMLGTLWRQFAGRDYLVAGAYNAGPRAMERWCERHGRRPVDEFIELVAFEQSREYIKRVLAIESRYQRLYGPGEIVLPVATPACP
jgi:soluble lytic murein transglycosylase